jgi:hypothetical protein
MSFSTDVKNELLLFENNNKHCSLAELYALINICGVFTDREDGKEVLVVVSENRLVTERFAMLLSELYGYNAEIQKSNGKYRITIEDATLINKISSDAHINRVAVDFAAITEETAINSSVVEKVCCKRAYIRSAFLCCGSVTNPEKQYHLEFVDSDFDHANALKSLIAYFGVEAKIIERKNHFVVYLKEGEQIVDVLNIISAHKALISFENSRILKEIRNKTNRIVNCETANINKTVNAAEKQREAIEYIADKIGLDKLPLSLREVARARLIYPFVSLKELGENMMPPIGKSGVNHRLKRICELAEKLKET